MRLKMTRIGLPWGSSHARTVVAAVFVLSMIVLFAIDREDVSAISVPKITVDGTSCIFTDRTSTYVSGTVYPAAGQLVILYSSNRQDIIGAVRMAKGGGKATFRIKVPEKMLMNSESLKLYIRSTSSGDVTASKFIPVELMTPEKAAKATQKTTKATQKTTKATKKTTKATKKTTKATKKTTKKATKAKKKAKKKKSKKNKRPTTAAAGRAAAVAWARKIAADDRFTYGAVPYSKHNGCYFCGTNGRKKREARGTRWANGYKGKKWDRTYCCNPFVHACYAHGAQHPTMLKNCQRKNAIDMTRSSYRKMGCFKSLGKPGYSKLIAGDILVSRTHVVLYCGNGEIAEATSINGKKKAWSAASIRVIKDARDMYRDCRFVMRFTGY